MEKDKFIHTVILTFLIGFLLYFGYNEMYIPYKERKEKEERQEKYKEMIEMIKEGMIEIKKASNEINNQHVDTVSRY
jgi:hypothetical protein